MNRISELRKAANLSQAALGKIVGAAQNTICNWENGNREPNHHALLTLSSVFNVSIDYLLGDTDNPGSFHETKKPAQEEDELSRKKMELIERIKKMESEDDLALLLQIADKVLPESEKEQ